MYDIVCPTVRGLRVRFCLTAPYVLPEELQARRESARKWLKIERFRAFCKPFHESPTKARPAAAASVAPFAARLRESRPLNSLNTALSAFKPSRPLGRERRRICIEFLKPIRVYHLDRQRVSPNLPRAEWLRLSSLEYPLYSCGLCPSHAALATVLRHPHQRQSMTHENGNGPERLYGGETWSERIAARVAERALPDSFAADVAERFELVWRKLLKRMVPRAWPQSFQKRLLGTVYIEFMERLRGEDVPQQLREIVQLQIDAELSLGLSRHEVLRSARAFATMNAEELLAPIIEGALEEASARLHGEIAATRDEIQRIGALSPSELHQFVQQYRWDDGYVHLFEVIRNRNCALGTAIMMYWRGRPHLLRHYEKRNEVPSFAIDNFDLLMRIENKIKRNGFRHYGIAYDPREDGGDLTRAAPTAVKKELPQWMYVATTVEGTLRFAPPPVAQSKSYWTGRKSAAETARAAG